MMRPAGCRRDRDPRPASHPAGRIAALATLMVAALAAAPAGSSAQAGTTGTASWPVLSKITFSAAQLKKLRTASSQVVFKAHPQAGLLTVCGPVALPTSTDFSAVVVDKYGKQTALKGSEVGYRAVACTIERDGAPEEGSQASNAVYISFSTPSGRLRVAGASRYDGKAYGARPIAGSFTDMTFVPVASSPIECGDDPVDPADFDLSDFITIAEGSPDETLRRATVVFESDAEYLTAIGVRAEALGFAVATVWEKGLHALLHVYDLVGMTNVVYRREAGVFLEIAKIYLYGDPDTDPWQSDRRQTVLDELMWKWGGGAGAELDAKRRQWFDGRRVALAHLLTGKLNAPQGDEIEIGGQAHRSNAARGELLCDGSTAYGMTAIDFPFGEVGSAADVLEMTGFSGDVRTFAHEVGHQFGAPHTFDRNPRLDCCNIEEEGDRDECLDDLGIPPAQAELGTIMSYCDSVRATFHPRDRGTIIAYADPIRASCITDVANRAPVIDSFTTSNVSPARGQSFTLSARASDADRDLLIYVWRLAVETTGLEVLEVQTRVASVQVALPDWAPTRRFTAFLRVVDERGAYAMSDMIYLTVPNTPPTLSDIRVIPLPPRRVGVQLTFFAAAGDGRDSGPVTVRWDFGDGTVPATIRLEDGGLTSPTHTYAQAGDYVVTVTATDVEGARTARQLPVQIVP